MTLDEAIKRYRDKEAEYKELASMYKEYEEFEMLQEDNRQLAEWLTELKEWKENPFWQIKTECKKNYDCNNCAFLNHCPFAHGNSVAAEYPMDWIVY